MTFIDDNDDDNNNNNNNNNNNKLHQLFVHSYPTSKLSESGLQLTQY